MMGQTIGYTPGHALILRETSFWDCEVFKGAAFRDKNRHLDDAVVFCATITSPLATAAKMKG